MRTTQLEERDFRIEDPEDSLRTLRGRVACPAGSEQAGERLPYVQVMHGFKGFMDWGFYPELTRRLVARGLAVVRFNFSGSGVGEEPGVFSEERAFFENTPSREVEDAERVRAWIDAGSVPWLDPGRGALLGHSMGGGVALLLAARRYDYRAIACWAPVASFRRFPPEVEALWRRQGFAEIPNVRTQQVHRLGLGWIDDLDAHARALDLHGACRRLSTPTLILHGDDDEAVPLEEGRSLAEAFAPGVCRLEVIEGTGHTFGASHPLEAGPGGVAATLPALGQVLELTAEFLRAHLG